jgi:multiple sugar transport system permease protein
MPTNSPISRLLGWGALSLGIAIALLPLAVPLLTSLAPAGTPAAQAVWPQQWTLANYRQAWQQGAFALAFANSTLVALAVTGLQIATSALAGYALARLRFRGRQTLLLVVLATLVVPFQILVVPVFLVLKWGNLLDTYAALILPTAANGFSIFLMRQYFMTVPVALEEAAALDGANRLQIVGRIMLPLARPALVALFVFTFIGEWNDLFKPLVFTTRPELTTVQLALAQFQQRFTSDWPLLMAAAAIATAPVVGVFLLAQRQVARGIGTTGIKY